MNSTSTAKAFGWAQFGLQALASVFAGGVPTNAAGWLGLVASLATAVGVHASANTDGTK